MIKKVLYVIFYIILMIAVLVGSYLFAQMLATKKTTTLPTIIDQQPLPTTKSQEPLFSGNIKKIDNDLGLFKNPNGVTYYEAGVFIRGEFKDYTRVLAIGPFNDIFTDQFVLATKDYKTYLLDDPINKTINYPETDVNNPYAHIDKNKIEKTVALDTEHPKAINLAKPYGLTKRDGVLLENKKTGEKNKNGGDIFAVKPVVEFDQSKFLASPDNRLVFYSQSLPEWSSKDIDLFTKQKFFIGTTTVQASDSTGLTYSYILALQKDIDIFLSKISSTPTKSLIFPGMKFTRSALGLSNDYYYVYDIAFPNCDLTKKDTYIMGALKDEDFKLLTSAGAYPIYTLKDDKHPLYNLAYRNKNINLKPTLEEYISKHPLIFFKDPWGRWGVMGESDIKKC